MHIPAATGMAITKMLLKKISAKEPSAGSKKNPAASGTTAEGMGAITSSTSVATKTPQTPYVEIIVWMYRTLCSIMLLMIHYPANLKSE
jgi:hypothetical protein